MAAANICRFDRLLHFIPNFQILLSCKSSTSRACLGHGFIFENVCIKRAQIVFVRWLQTYFSLSGPANRSALHFLRSATWKRVVQGKK